MLVFFLSTGKVGELMRHLMEQGGLAEDTPAAIVYRASWPDERILRGTVGDIARQAEEAGLGRQALVIVGRALGANGTASRLYDADFSHGYRNRLVSENFDGRCALYAFTDKGLTRSPGDRRRAGPAHGAPQYAPIQRGRHRAHTGPRLRQPPRRQLGAVRRAYLHRRDGDPLPQSRPTAARQEH